MKYKGFMMSMLILTTLIGYLLFVSINKNIDNNKSKIKLENTK